MNRRDGFLLGLGLAMTTATGRLVAQEHVHVANHNGDLQDAALHCVSTGERCLAHCHQQLATGDATLAACAASVSTLVSVCTTLAALAAQSSQFLPRFAALTAEVCSSCERECRKHDEHAECKACAEACKACAAACKAMA